MGRDQLFDLFRFHGLLVRKRKRLIRTTNLNNWLKKYSNLVKGLNLISAEQLCVSDINYIRTLEGFSYLSLITDAYSRKIVGFALHPMLEATGCIKALQMTFSKRKKESVFNFIHHSDRDIQYCSGRYTGLLQKEKIAISMTQSASPNENALAERMKGIIKNEFLPKRCTRNTKMPTKLPANSAYL